MKFWTFVVAGLYALVLASLTIPVLLVGPWKLADLHLLAVYGAWPYWLWLVLMAGCQLVLLMVPVRLASGRPIKRGALWPTIALSALMMALLGASAAGSIYAAVFGDAPLFEREQGLLGAAVIILWVLWTILFRRLAHTQAPDDFITTLCTRLVRGSILELLIAVPCHIVVRCRQDCCAGIYTMFGLAMGLSVMLFAFGPAVYFLFLARARRLQTTAGTQTATTAQ